MWIKARKTREVLQLIDARMQEHASMPKEAEYEIPDTVSIERVEETLCRPPIIRDIPQQLRPRNSNTKTRQTLINPKKTTAIDDKLAHRILET